MGKQKKTTYHIQLNEVKQSDDPTRLPCTFIIFDFEKSHNNTVISKEVSLEVAPTIINKPIVAKYHEVEDTNTPTDAFGSHEAHLDMNKKGELFVNTDTVPIGVFTSEGYIMTINTAEGEKEVLAADAILWKSRFQDACDLLVDWYNRGININTSCEILYKNFTFKDGIEYIQSPVYLDGHCILNSEQRGGHNVVLPAYESSKLVSFNEIQEFQRLVAQAMLQEQKDGEEMNVEETVVETEVVESTDEVVETVESVENTDAEEVTIEADFSSEDVEEIAETTEIEESVEEVQESQDNLESLKLELESIKLERDNLLSQLSEMDKQVKELLPYKEQIETALFEQKLAEAKEIYEKKFKALNASTKFESDEVQELIITSLKDSDEGKEAKFKLNSILVDLVELKEEMTSTPIVKEFASKTEKLIPNSESFDAKYK